MRVIFFITNLDSGGIENYLLRFLTAYGGRFEKILIICKGGRGGVLEQEFQCMPNVTIKKTRIGNSHPHHYFKLKNWLKAYRDSIVCDFTGNFAGPILWAAKRAGVKKRIAFYRSSSNRFKEDRLRLLIDGLYNTLVLRYASNILANSEYAFQFFFTQLDNRFRVIYNGIDFESFLSVGEDLREELGVGKDTFVIGHTGRYNSAKNHSTILNVARNILRSHAGVVFILCGKGVRENIQPLLDGDKQFKRYRDHIFLFENRSDISKFLNTCDAYIFPSLTEGQPNSLLEAWGKGLPFVASNIKPIEEITKQEFREFLESPYDVEGFTKQLVNFIKGGFTESQKDELREWAQNTFDSKKRFHEFYEELTS